MNRRLLFVLAICLLIPIAGAARPSALSDLSHDVAAIARQASPATVQIEVERSASRVAPADFKGLLDRFRDPKAPKTFDAVARSVGSGFVIDPSGHILTTRDVVGDAKKITVKFADGSTAAAELKGSDDVTDAAVIKVEKSGLRALALGDSDSLEPGMLVIMVNSQSGLSSSVSLGVVASMDREASPVVGPVMQISGTIGPGASGGAVLDTEGRVVGVSFAMLSPTARFAPWFNLPKIFVAPSTESGRPAETLQDLFRQAQAEFDKYGFGVTPGMPDAEVGIARDLTENMIDLARTSGSSGFAIPINKIKPIIDRLKSGKPIERAMLGIELTESHGEIILSPVEGQPAAKAGVKKGDVLVSIDGRKYTKIADVIGYVTGLKPGDKVDLVVRRSGKQVPITVTTTVRTQRADQPRKPAEMLPSRPSLSKTFSLDIEDAGIAEVAKALSEASGRSVIVVNPEKIPGRVTVHLRSTTVDTALSFICSALDCKSSKSGEGYVIRPAK